MMTDEQRSKVAELKAAIAATATTREGTPMEVRTATVALKEELRRGGITARVLAAAVGVHESTLCRWDRESGARREPGVAKKPVATKRARRRRASFRMVRVAATTVSSASTPREMIASSSPPPPRTSSRGLRVAHAPSGLVVDGLDVETLASLLRRMT